MRRHALDAPWPRLATMGLAALALLVAALLAGCISIGAGGDAAPRVHLTLRDPGVGSVTRRAAPVVDALVLQPQPSSALADTLGIAYARREHELAYYQLATWTERPVRQVPLLLQRRLEARGVCGAVGMVGDPLRADWLLSVAIDTLHHDVRSPPGQAQVALTVDLFDRRSRSRVARGVFTAQAPVAQADSAAAAQALSEAVAQAFDELVPWLEVELQRAAAMPR